MVAIIEDMSDEDDEPLMFMSIPAMSMSMSSP